MTRSSNANTPNYPPQTKPSADGREQAESTDLVDAMEHGKQSATDTQSTPREAEGTNRSTQASPQNKPQGDCGCG